MKKSIFLLTFMLSAAAIPADAQNCTSPTRCGELGYNKTKDDCTGKESLVCPFDSSKVFCAIGGGIISISGTKPGMIVYSDGSFSADVVAGKTPIGVVAYGRKLISLDETSLNWGAAMSYCNNYQIGGSGWYLPTKDDWSLLRFNYSTINASLQKLGKTALSANYYWSSSEYTGNYGAWSVRPSDGYMYDGSRDSAGSVRCVLAF